MQRNIESSPKKAEGVDKCVHYDHTGCEWKTKDFGEHQITGCWPTNSPIEIKHTHPYNIYKGDYCGKSHSRGFCKKVSEGKCELIQTTDFCTSDTSK
jgi:hypothetical protein